MGLNHVPDGMMLDQSARQYLPPSFVLCGRVSYLLARDRVTRVRASAFSLALCGTSAGRPPRQSSCAKVALPGLCGGIGSGRMQNLLDGKMIDEHSNYRWQAEETWSVAFLLFFLACQAGLARAAPAVLRSFTLLKAICSELRVLRWRWLPLRDQEELQALSDLQRDHQQAFLVAHGAELLRPKHHYRFHLVDACLRLRCLSTVAAHEKKHRALKSSGLLDNQKKRLHSSLSLQEVYCPDCLKNITGRE